MPKKKLIYYIDELNELYQTNIEKAKSKALEVIKLFPDDIAVNSIFPIIFKLDSKTTKTHREGYSYYILFNMFHLTKNTKLPLKEFIPKSALTNLNKTNKIPENENAEKYLTFINLGFTLLEAIRKSKNDCQEILKKLYLNNYTYTEIHTAIFTTHQINPDWYYDNVDLKQLIKELEDLTEGKNIINSLSLKNYFSIENIELKDLGKRKEIYFLGENGDGKTILLQSILLALKGNEGREAVFSFIKDNDDFLRKHNKKELSLSAKASNNREYIFEREYLDQKTEYINIYAYGVNRLRKSEKETDKSGYASLFDVDAYLTSPEQWLKDVQLKYYSDKDKGKSSITTITPSQAKSLLEQVINFEEGKNNLEVRVDGTNIRFVEKGTELQFEQLSDGYKSILILLSDLLSRLSTNQPFVSKAKDYTGIVLIDELGVYLHPKWEYSITGLLRNLFPNIQWIFTTHSPIILFGASKDAVFYKLYKEEGITKVSEAFSMETFSNKSLNAFVTSSLFNLPSSKPAAYQKSEHDFETGNYIYDIIHSEVRKRLDENPLQDNEIKDMVAKLLEKFEKEGKI